MLIWIEPIYEPYLPESPNLFRAIRFLFGGTRGMRRQLTADGLSTLDIRAARCSEWVVIPKRMLIKAYRVESHRHGSVDFGPGPVLIGIVQFPGYDGMEDQQREEEKALDLLASHSPQAARHPVLGFVT